MEGMEPNAKAQRENAKQSQTIRTNIGGQGKIERFQTMFSANRR